jgi:hypothetical protein
MIDLDDIKSRPWTVSDLSNQLGLSALVASSVIEAIATAQLKWPDLKEENAAVFEAFKLSERRELLKFMQPDRLQGLFKRFEAVLKAGRVTELGRMLSSSPHRYDATVVSVLSSNARIP